MNSSQQSRGSGCGCLSGGCAAFAVVMVILLGLIGAGGFLMYQKLREFTSAEAAPVPVYQPTPEQVQDVKNRVALFKQAISSNTDAELDLSADDLNSLV